MTMINTVNVDHGYNHENKHFSQQIGSKIVFVGEEINNSFHRKGSGCLSGMDSGRNQDNRFVEFEGSFVLWEEGIIKNLFELVLFILMIVRGDGEEVDISVFRAFGQNFFIKVEIVDVEKVVELIDVVEVGLVGVGVTEGKVDALLFTFK